MESSEMRYYEAEDSGNATYSQDCIIDSEHGGTAYGGAYVDMVR